jgi:hypothetical protein
VRQKIGSERDDDDEGRRAQIELGSLEHAPDAEPSPLAARRAELDPDSDHDKRDGHAGEKGVGRKHLDETQPGGGGQKVASGESHHDHEGEKAKRERAHREAAPEVRTGQGQRRLGNLGDRGRSERDPHAKRTEKTSEPKATLAIAQIEPSPQFAWRGGAIGFEGENEHGDHGADAK